MGSRSHDSKSWLSFRRTRIPIGRWILRPRDGCPDKHAPFGKIIQTCTTQSGLSPRPYFSSPWSRADCRVLHVRHWCLSLDLQKSQFSWPTLADAFTHGIPRPVCYHACRRQNFSAMWPSSHFWHFFRQWRRASDSQTSFSSLSDGPPRHNYRPSCSAEAEDAREDAVQNIHTISTKS